MGGRGATGERPFPLEEGLCPLPIIFFCIFSRKYHILTHSVTPVFGLIAYSLHIVKFIFIRLVYIEATTKSQTNPSSREFHVTVKLSAQLLS